MKLSKKQKSTHFLCNVISLKIKSKVPFLELKLSNLGVLRSDVTCVFNHNQIKEVCFVGYKNEESTNFVDNIVTLALQLQKSEEIENNYNKTNFQVEALESE